jgi:Ni/Fe-hydrogenase subunit HybB-like protein
MIKGLTLPRPTFWRIVLVVLFAFGLYTTIIRFTQGLGASTNLNDDFPWGLWIGFDILCGVALAAGGFTISAAVYIFNIERFRPIVRPTILTAFLGYCLVVVALFFDLGQGHRIWHPLVMWNPRSVMFEIGWCVSLYSTVLALEFSPMLLEKLGWQKPLKIVKTFMLPLVILGVILSTLHQSSLGSLYLIVPGKLHPLWYSAFLPVFFFVSAIALGCAMTIFESFLSWRAFRRRIELDLLSDLGKVMVVVLSVYLVLKVQDMMSRDILALAFQPTYEGRLFLAELLLGTIAPIAFLLIPAVRKDDMGLFMSALMVIAGFILNRLNVSLTGMESAAASRYQPHWMEITVTLCIVGLGFLLFALAVRYLNVFPAEETDPAHAEVTELPFLEQVRRPWFSTTKVVMVSGALVFAMVLGIAAHGVVLRYRADALPGVAAVTEIAETGSEGGALSPAEP